MITVKPVAKRFMRNGKEEVRWIGIKTFSRPLKYDQLIVRIVHATTATRGDVELIVSALIDQLDDALQEGYSVQVGRLGSFDLSVRSSLWASAGECVPGGLRVSKLFFRPGYELRRKIRREARFRVVR